MNQNYDGPGELQDTGRTAPTAPSATTILAPFRQMVNVLTMIRQQTGTLRNSGTMGPLFIANHRFGPWHAERWQDFVTQSGLTQLEELVSLDALLCAPVLDQHKEDYWPYIVNQDFMLDYFTDLGFMLRQLPDSKNHNVLCVFRNPTSHPIPPSEILQFEFAGYDLVDKATTISSLSNCGGFPKAFSNGQLNKLGLLRTRDTATKVQISLREIYPDEPHATDCDVWAIFRAVQL